MIDFNKGLFTRTALLAASAALFIPGIIRAQATSAPASTDKATTSASKSASGERWLHVRVINTDNRGETVRVNVPLEMAEKVLPAVSHDRLHNGKVRINEAHMDDVDLHAIMDAIRTSKDGESSTLWTNKVPRSARWKSKCR
jgi:hypothetical protein